MGDYEAVLGTAEAYGQKRRGSEPCGNPRHRLSWLLLSTSVIASAFPLLLIGLIFTAGAWLSWALQQDKRNLTTNDWNKLYRLVGSKILQPRNWFMCSFVLAWCLMELALMLYTGYMISHNKVLYRIHSRMYVLVHLFGAVLKLYLLGILINGGVRVITEHINGPENFMTG